jgi:hypothetical protein
MEGRREPTESRGDLLTLVDGALAQRRDWSFGKASFVAHHAILRSTPRR